MARNDSFQKKWAAVPSQFERPSDALIDRGWAGGAAEDPPEAKWENWWHNRVDEALAEIESNGALTWFEDVSYGIGATARSGGKTWIAAISSSGIEPGGVDDVGHWQELSLQIASQAEAEDGDEATANNVKRMTPLRVLQAIKARLINASETVVGMLRVGTQAEVGAGALDTVAVTPLKLAGVRMRRITRVSSAALQTISGSTTGPVAFTPLNVNFTADGGLYLILVKMNMNTDTGGTTGSNYFAVKLMNGATVLDASAQNIVTGQLYGSQLNMLWSGTLTGPISLSVTFEKTTTVGSLTVNGDRDNTTSNDSGQLSCIEVYRMGA